MKNNFGVSNFIQGRETDTDRQTMKGRRIETAIGKADIQIDRQNDRNNNGKGRHTDIHKAEWIKRALNQYIRVDKWRGEKTLSIRLLHWTRNKG